MDNICELKRLPNQNDLVQSFETEYVYRVFKHSTRTVLAEEALAISSLGYDTAENLINQLDNYVQYLPLQLITPLNTCTVLLRQHNHLQVIRHGRMWWEHILNFSKRDQMSFDFCRLQSGLKLSNFLGTKFENDLIWNHNNSAPDRLLASFDSEKYKKLVTETLERTQRRLLTEDEDNKLRHLSTRKPSRFDVIGYLTQSPLSGLKDLSGNISEELLKILESNKKIINKIAGAYLYLDSDDSAYTLIEFEKCQFHLATYLGLEQSDKVIIQCFDDLKQLEKNLDEHTLLCIYNVENRYDGMSPTYESRQIFSIYFHHDQCSLRSP
jgi:hypothetical protein